MKIIQHILQKTKASKLWFVMAVVFIAILNVSTVEAKSLKTGEEYKQKNGWSIRVISSDEVEVDGQGNNIFLGKYTVDGERVRVVIGMLGTNMVSYYKITPDGLVEEKNGTIYYSKAGLAALAAANEKKYRAEQEAAVKEKKMRAERAAAKFTFIGDEVTDKKTELIWRRCAEGMKYSGGTCTGTASEFTYEEALQHAADQASSTGKAWRVPWRAPEKDELASIIDKSYREPAIDPYAFPVSPSGLFWTDQLYGGDSLVNFSDGSVHAVNRTTSQRFYVRLVRTGQRENRADENANTAPQSNAVSASKYPNKGKVLEVMDASIYTYMQVTSDKGPIWVAASKTSVPMGATISYPNGAAMTNFFSKALNRTFDAIIFVDKIEVLK